MEQVDGFKAFPTDLCVKVDSAGGNSTLFKNHEHTLGCQVDIRRKLVCVPTEQQIARIGVDASQCPLDAGIFKFMHHRMPCERRMVCFDIELDVIHQAVRTTEIQARGCIEVILMFCWLFRLGFEQELSFESDLFRVIDSHMHESGEMIQFTFHVGIEQVVIAFAATPKDIVFTTQFVRHFQGFLHLGCCECEDIGVAGGGSAVHESRVRKHVCCPPQQLDPRPFLRGF